MFLWKSSKCSDWTALRILKVTDSLGDRDDHNVVSKFVVLQDVTPRGLLANLFPEDGSVQCKITKAEIFTFTAVITKKSTKLKFLSRKM
jgi:hypothetical protein